MKIKSKTLNIPLTYDRVTIDAKGKSTSEIIAKTDSQLEEEINDLKKSKRNELYEKIKEKTIKKELEEDCSTVDKEIEVIKNIINL